jgi:hypothetical protein
MTSNYTPMPPPQSPGPADQPEQNWIPRSVSNAVSLMFLLVALSAFSLIFLLADRSAVEDAIRRHDHSLTNTEINDRTNTAVAAGVVIGIILLLLFVLLALQVRKGKNWARIVTWVFSGLGVIGAVVNIFSPNPFLAKIISGVNIAIYLGVITFLAAGASNAYFQRSRRVR